MRRVDEDASARASRRSLRGTLHLARTNAFFLGGGKALMNSYYAAAERLGIEVRYDAEVVALDLDDGACRSATVQIGDAHARAPAREAVVLAAGGFEANLDWLREAWGDAAQELHRARHAVQHEARSCG